VIVDHAKTPVYVTIADKAKVLRDLE